MKVGLVAFFTMAGVIVWIFAAIGALSIARAVGNDPPGVSATPESILARAESDVPGGDVAGLPRYQDSTRTEYRVAVWKDLAITEVEYRVADQVSLVRAHYHRALREGGWTIESREQVRGEWVYELSSGDRTVELEIERIEGMTEIEIEATAPLRQRGSGSAR